MSEKKYLTTMQIANRLHISNRTVYKYIKKGMPFYKVGGYRFDPVLVDAWFEKFTK